MQMKWLRFIFLSIAFNLFGCAIAPGLYISESGYKQASQIEAVSERGEVLQPYKVIPIDAPLVNKLRQESQPGLISTEASQALQRELADYQYRIKSQDILNITVWDHPELTIPAGEFRDAEDSGYLVEHDGTIFFPYVGIVHVADKTVRDIREIITRRIGTFITKPQIGVRVAAFRSQKVHVIGEVKEPGIKPITDVPLTALEALNLAGGAGIEADLSRVSLTRGAQTRTLNLQDLYDYGDVSQNILMLDGDVLHVPDRSTNMVLMLGEVKKPAAYIMNKGRKSLAELIGESEGFDNLASNPGKIYVIRSIRDKPSIFRLDASSADALILATKFPLKPQDVVYVSTTRLARWNRVIQNILPTVTTLFQTDRLIND